MERETAAKYVIAHLFMFADRQINRRQLDCLDNYGEELWNLSDIKAELADVYDKGGVTLESKAMKKLKECIKKMCSDVLYTFDDHPSRSQMECMWIVVSLACSREGIISKNHTALLKMLADEWKINKDILMEMQDTVETKMVLYKHKDWINCVSNDDDKNNLISAAKKDKKALEQSVEDLIADIAGDMVDTEESKKHSKSKICTVALKSVDGAGFYRTGVTTENEAE
ncbi:hypothetical protein AGMMS50212_10240 [Spirochaetia bacterium]|nr:hypothetical protein AGMMS50212_10240 [Spirochaetia bacterium]